MPEFVDIEMDARGVARLTINRGAKANALSSAVMRDLIAGFKELSTRDRLRSVVLASAGNKSFIGGADVREMAALDAASARAFITLVHETCQAARDCPVPVVARIQGHTLGAGLELAAACDLRVASSRAVFGMPEVRIGLPSVVEAALLPRLIGAGRARWLVLTGANIDAEQALRWGLIEQVVDSDALDPTVDALVDMLIANGPLAIRVQKRLTQMWEDTPLESAIAQSIDVFVQGFARDESITMLRASAERL
ncbi:MAG: enoyl-CoA hydratase [Burkholderiales bacterium]